MCSSDLNGDISLKEVARELKTTENYIRKMIGLSDKIDAEKYFDNWRMRRDKNWDRIKAQRRADAEMKKLEIKKIEIEKEKNKAFAFVNHIDKVSSRSDYNPESTRRAISKFLDGSL